MHYRADIEYGSQLGLVLGARRNHIATSPVVMIFASKTS